MSWPTAEAWAVEELQPSVGAGGDKLQLAGLKMACKGRRSCRILAGGGQIDPQKRCLPPAEAKMKPLKFCVLILTVLFPCGHLGAASGGATGGSPGADDIASHVVGTEPKGAGRL